jgi:hypothetical protein
MRLKSKTIIKRGKLLEFRIPLPKQRCQPFRDITKYTRKDKFKGADRPLLHMGE